MVTIGSRTEGTKLTKQHKRKERENNKEITIETEEGGEEQNRTE
jgi:hypothetical protein